MVSLTFSNPSALLFLLAIPVMIVVHLLTHGRAKSKAVLFANFEAIKRVVDAKDGRKSATSTSRTFTLLIYRVITFSLLVLAVSGTTFWYSGLATDQDFVLAIDASSSMLARDVEPNRFDAAKQSAVSFVEGLTGGSRVGIVSFSGTAFVAQRPTADRQDTINSIETLRIREVSGTDIASALILSTNELRDANKTRTIVLITDGRQTQGASIDEALRYAQENRARIYPIGIGTEQGGSFLRNDLVSSLDPETLNEIAAQTGTQAFIATSAEELDTAFASIRDLSESQVPVNLASPLLLIAMALLFLEWGLISTRFRELP